MLNVYLTYVSSLETGDVNISKRVYTNHGKAIDDIDSMIEQYVKDIKSENAYKVVLKEDFDIKKLNKDSTVPIGGYVFERKKSSVAIYKKAVVEGRVWNGSKLEKVGKIGILPEINIPVDKKLMKLIEAIQDGSSEDLVGSDENKSPRDVEIPEAPEGPDSVSNRLDQYQYIKKGPSNYEHGKHVSFINELKNKLVRRTNTNVIIEKMIETNKPNSDHIKFLSDLSLIKSRLNHISPPVTPVMGRIVTVAVNAQSIDESPSPSIPDFPAVPIFPSRLPSPPKICPDYSYSENSYSDDDNDSDEDWDPSSDTDVDRVYEGTPYIAVSNILYESGPEYKYYPYDDEFHNHEYINYEYYDTEDDENETGLVLPDVPNYDNVEKIVEDIMHTINNNNHNHNNNNTNTNKQHDEDSISIELPTIGYSCNFNDDQDWILLNYYENVWRDDL